MWNIVVMLLSVLAHSAQSGDLTNYERLSVQISEDVGVDQCNQTLTQLEVSKAF